MTIKQVMETLDAELLTPEADLTREVHAACGSDMMSDVLAYVKDQAVLVTGLNNPQVVRTADMMDMICIVFVRGKKPDGAILQLAVDRGIAVLATKLPMFAACGLQTLCVRLPSHCMRERSTWPSTRAAARSTWPLPMRAWI